MDPITSSHLEAFRGRLTLYPHNFTTLSALDSSPLRALHHLTRENRSAHAYERVWSKDEARNPSHSRTCMGMCNPAVLLPCLGVADAIYHALPYSRFERAIAWPSRSCFSPDAPRLDSAPLAEWIGPNLQPAAWSVARMTPPYSGRSHTPLSAIIQAVSRTLRITSTHRYWRLAVRGWLPVCHGGPHRASSPITAQYGH